MDNPEQRQGNEQVIQMLANALEKAKQGTGRSAVLLTIKPNGIDISGQFSHPDDLSSAIAKCDELKRGLVKLRSESNTSDSY